jgi:hypothetical protein
MHSSFSLNRCENNVDINHTHPSTDPPNTGSLDLFAVPEKSITLTETKSDDEKSVLIECDAQGVFPEPTLKLFQGSETDM